jgi:tetratricopeptide (TPR) repeat protein
MPRQLAPSGVKSGGSAFTLQDIARLMRETNVLKVEREKLKAEHDEATQPMERADASHAGDIIKLRLRLAEILTKVSTQGTAEESRVPAKPLPGPRRAASTVLPTKPPSSEREKSAGVELPKNLLTNQRPQSGADPDKPLEPLALAAALFRTGDYEGALTTYRLIDSETLSKHDRVAIQYLQGCCLRKLGKTDQAASLYREVANTKDDEVLAECAQWQLGALQWRHELETQIQQIRQRRQALEVKP